MAMNLNEDFRELLQLLNDHEVKYLVVGAFAVANYGYVRATGDIDIWIEVSEANADKMEKVINDFGFSSLGLSKKEFLDDDAIYQLGFPPARIDIITCISGVSFEEAYLNKREVEIGELKIVFIGLKELKKNKLATGRTRDLADLEALGKEEKI